MRAPWTVTNLLSGATAVAWANQAGPGAGSPPRAASGRWLLCRSNMCRAVWGSRPGTGGTMGVSDMATDLYAGKLLIKCLGLAPFSRRQTRSILFFRPEQAFPAHSYLLKHNPICAGQGQ